ncbi:restriction endonuclease [Shewanella sp. GXUN23E]|uniref:restriction endonuclease n=1 Tax=Shewanella sp. GXUN23E TaxID=3422498 RepID=UPI003D7D3298
MTTYQKVLIVDQVYRGSRNGNASDDPLPSLLGVDNGAGFRHLGKRPNVETLKLLVLKTSFTEVDWPDHLDTETGVFTYYGDNRRPGRELHDTPRQGNLMLRNLFNAAHSEESLEHFPPIFVFAGTGVYRDVRFLGLAVPGTESLNEDEDLVAIWRATGKENLRFQNYKSKFTILDIPAISEDWLKDIKQGNAVSSSHAPKLWLDWLQNRKYRSLKAPRISKIRSKEQQLPLQLQDKKIIDAIYSKYKYSPTDFEYCAVKIAKLYITNITTCDVTRPSVDGGRDAIGQYRIGNSQAGLSIDFALEAKCYSVKNGVGVKELSRLISRLRHRQFGILVTTSYVAKQAYQEINEDKHPIIIISAVDICNILRKHIGSLDTIEKWI